MVRLAPRLYRNLLLIWYNHPADHPAVSSNSIERSGPSITGLRALHQFPQGSAWEATSGLGFSFMLSGKPESARERRRTEVGWGRCRPQNGGRTRGRLPFHSMGTQPKPSQSPPQAPFRQSTLLTWLRTGEKRRAEGAL